MHFSDRLDNAIKAKGNPICVGLDPRFDQLPLSIRDAAIKEHGHTAEAVAQAFLTFNKAILDAVSDLVPVCKPQVAFYEEFGWQGMRAYADTIRYAKEKGLIVISDAKRGDIGATALAYARAHLGSENIEIQNAGFDADALTVNPYLGRETLEPYLDVGIPSGRGIFVLVKTSNAGSGDLQDLQIFTDAMSQESAVSAAHAQRSSGNTGSRNGQKFVYEHVAALVDQLGKKYRGQKGLTDVGAVVGATYPEEARRLRECMPETIFLIPGYGAQGGSAKDAAAGFRDDGRGAIINNSRGIIFAYKHEKFAKARDDFAAAARMAVLEMAQEIKAVLG